jgi:integrase
MKVPTPRKLSSGKWFLTLRLGGESINLSNYDKTALIREARLIKSEYQAGKRIPTKKEHEKITVSDAIDRYIKDKENTLSPSTIRGYRAIQKNRFEKAVRMTISEAEKANWQKIVDEESKLCAAKYLKNAYAFISSCLLYVAKIRLPNITLPTPVKNQIPFLQPEEIPKFIAAVKDTNIAVPALLALSSMRISEISALRWEDIPPNPDFIKTRGAVVRDENNQWVSREQQKNLSSSRNVPILIPELKAAIERDRKESGPVIGVKQDTLRLSLHRICKKAGITDVTVHGLRHSFASLSYHLRVPEKITMEIGGWKDPATMRNIYTKIANSDITRYQTQLHEFYQNANKNAN